MGAFGYHWDIIATNHQFLVNNIIVIFGKVITRGGGGGGCNAVSRYVKSFMGSFSINFGNSSALNIFLVNDLSGILTVALIDGGIICHKELTQPDNAVMVCDGADDG